MLMQRKMFEPWSEMCCLLFCIWTQIKMKLLSLEEMCINLKAKVLNKDFHDLLALILCAGDDSQFTTTPKFN